MNILILSGFLLTLCFSAAIGSYFTLIGPRTVQHKSVYEFVLSTTYRQNDNAALNVTFIGKTSKENIYDETYPLYDISKNRILQIDLTHHKIVENFTLSASLIYKKDNFTQNVDVFVIPKKYSVFIQTDKPVYKPGDDILYRIIVLDSNMKAYDVKEKQLMHQIYDGLGNLMPESIAIDTNKPDTVDESQGPGIDETEFSEDETSEVNPENNEWADQFGSKGPENRFVEKRKGEIHPGIFSYHYKLVDEPAAGKWYINVTVDNEHQFSTIQQFDVKRYILPHFEVFIDTKQHVDKDEGDIRLNVFANYTFGKFVSGKAKVTGFVQDMQHPLIIHRQVTKEVDVEMKNMVSFDVEKDLQIFNSIRPYEVKFDVEFEETLTGQKGTASTTVRVYRYNQFYISIIKEKRRFKPGFPYKFAVQVLQANGEPAPRVTESLKLFVDYYYKPVVCTPLKDVNKLVNKYAYTEKKELINGKADFLLHINDNTTAFTIKATYFDSAASSKVLRHEAGSKEYLTIRHIKKIEKKVVIASKIGDNIEIEVKVTSGIEPLTMHYIVISRHGIAQENIIRPEFEDDKAVVNIPATENMTPTCKVIVYYFQLSGEIIYDQVKVDIAPESFHAMGMLFQDEKITKMPGQSCKLLTKALPGSFVSLLGVDQSVKLLGHGNDIDKERVAAGIKLFDSSTYAEEEKDGTSKYSDFSEANAFLITNAVAGEKKCVLSDRITDVELSRDDSPPDDFYDEDDDIPDASRVRKVFPETWIFKDFEMGSNGKNILSTVVPDTITSFIVSGFAIHPEKGLSIATPRKITVFKEFFVKLFVPYSIRLGEILKVDISVFNYLSAGKKDIQATIALTEQQEFEFINANMATCSFTSAGQSSQSKTVSVPYNNGASTYFLIRANKVGLLKLEVKAITTSSAVTDTIVRSIKVEREGYRETENKAHLIDLRNKTTDSYDFEISFPANYIGDSIQISASVIGDLLGPALVNVQDLIRKPSGCTEQTFKSFIPNIVAMKYLKAIGKLTASYKTSGESHLTHGHQELMNRRQTDGSFSLWGEKGASSVWLTAYVAKVLGHTKEFVSVNDRTIYEALDFVRKHQHVTTGGYSDSNVHDYIYISKTASQRGLALTAFIAIAFLENPDHVKDFKDTIDKTLEHLSGQVVSLKDSQSMAMTAYAFALNGKDDEAKNVLVSLKEEAIQNNEITYWANSSPSVQVETAAYAVMAYVKTGHAFEALPIVNWLISQRQVSGGFFATTDTVIGIQALAMYATVVYSPLKNVDVTLSYEKERKVEFKVNEGNALVLQVKGVKPDGRKFRLHSNGNGYAYFQLTYSCSVNVDDPERKFEIRADPQTNGNDNILHLQICASFIPTGSQTQSGMTVIEVYLPSGYEYDPETADLFQKVGVKRVETAHQKTLIVLYFNSMTATKVCPEIKATRKSVVENLRSSPVKIYDYYNKHLRASSFYAVKINKKCGF